ncbi:IucA/IucC family protein, partial [Streptomyces albidoflavus]|uniref:IucA/IucC family protein n=1 Tax=Streptomyces albidoflavus TaxID=1886 RepID=UPI0010DBBB23
MSDTTPTDQLAAPTAHLTPELWAAAGRHLVRKGLAEFSHERLLKPEPLPGAEPDAEGRTAHRVVTDDGVTEYRFAAKLLSLDHWDIAADSITRHGEGGIELPLDALDFILDTRTALGIGDAILPVYLEEISSTLSGAAWKLAQARPSAAELARAGFQAIETGMTEGHPCFVANNGRIGFDVREYHQYAPETASPVRLLWLAARATAP